MNYEYKGNYLSLGTSSNYILYRVFEAGSSCKMIIRPRQGKEFEIYADSKKEMESIFFEAVVDALFQNTKSRGFLIKAFKENRKDKSVDLFTYIRLQDYFIDDLIFYARDKLKINER